MEKLNKLMAALQALTSEVSALKAASGDSNETEETYQDRAARIVANRPSKGNIQCPCCPKSYKDNRGGHAVNHIAACLEKRDKDSDNDRASKAAKEAKRRKVEASKRQATEEANKQAASVKGLPGSIAETTVKNVKDALRSFGTDVDAVCSLLAVSAAMNSSHRNKVANHLASQGARLRHVLYRNGAAYPKAPETCEAVARLGSKHAVNKWLRIMGDNAESFGVAEGFSPMILESERLARFANLEWSANAAKGGPGKGRKSKLKL